MTRSVKSDRVFAGIAKTAMYAISFILGLAIYYRGIVATVYEAHTEYSTAGAAVLAIAGIGLFLWVGRGLYRDVINTIEPPVDPKRDRKK